MTGGRVGAPAAGVGVEVPGVVTGVRSEPATETPLARCDRHRSLPPPRRRPPWRPGAPRSAGAARCASGSRLSRRSPPSEEGEAGGDAGQHRRDGQGPAIDGCAGIAGRGRRDLAKSTSTGTDWFDVRPYPSWPEFPEAPAHDAPALEERARVPAARRDLTDAAREAGDRDRCGALLRFRRRACRSDRDPSSRRGLSPSRHRCASLRPRSMRHPGGRRPASARRPAAWSRCRARRSSSHPARDVAGCAQDAGLAHPCGDGADAALEARHGDRDGAPDRLPVTDAERAVATPAGDRPRARDRAHVPGATGDRTGVRAGDHVHRAGHGREGRDGGPEHAELVVAPAEDRALLRDGAGVPVARRDRGDPAREADNVGRREAPLRRPVPELPEVVRSQALDGTGGRERAGVSAVRVDRDDTSREARDADRDAAVALRPVAELAFAVGTPAENAAVAGQRAGVPIPRRSRRSWARGRIQRSLRPPSSGARSP